jgi:hypothetical protein
MPGVNGFTDEDWAALDRVVKEPVTHSVRCIRVGTGGISRKLAQAMSWQWILLAFRSIMTKWR